MIRNRRLAALTCLICLLVSMPVAASPQASVYSWLDELIAFVSEIFGNNQETAAAAEGTDETEDLPAIWPTIEPVG